jgi:hypothetical protein
MDITPPSQDDVPPLDLEYAQEIVKSAMELERVQRMLPLVPDALKKLMRKQSEPFLYGMVTMGQALHDLLGKGILNEVAFLIEEHSDNEQAMDIGAEVVRLIAMMETLGYLTCKEITDRAKR